MTTRLDVEYYRWLVDQIDIRNGNTFNKLFEIMHNVEFIWTIQGDDSRVADAIELRQEFTNEREPNLNLGSATFLEVVIALSRRAAFISGEEKLAPQWAWILLKNIHVHTASDPLSPDKTMHLNDRLNVVIWRQYREDGHGGFFPLQNPEQDQTQVEIWYQMNAYINEMSDL
jgi:hypothetical protein